MFFNNTDLSFLSLILISIKLLKFFYVLLLLAVIHNSLLLLKIQNIITCLFDLCVCVPQHSLGCPTVCLSWFSFTSILASISFIKWATFSGPPLWSCLICEGIISIYCFILEFSTTFFSFALIIIRYYKFYLYLKIHFYFQYWNGFCNLSISNLIFICLFFFLILHKLIHF